MEIILMVLVLLCVVITVSSMHKAVRNKDAYELAYECTTLIFIAILIGTWS